MSRHDLPAPALQPKPWKFFKAFTFRFCILKYICILLLTFVEQHLLGNMSDDEAVKLQSGDNEVFSVSKEVACQAVTIKEMLEG